MKINCITCLLLFQCASTIAQAQNVSLEIRVVKERDANSEGVEVPVPDEKVYVTLFSGSLPPQYTDAHGFVRFSFPQTPYLIARIGDPRTGIKLPRMSGRKDQVTSVYYKGGYGAGFNELDSILEFVQDIKNARTHNTVLPKEIAEELKKIRSEYIERAPGESEDMRKMRQEIVRISDQALSPLGTLGIQYVSENDGTIVRRVDANSVASEIGLQTGDRITKINGYNVNKQFQLPNAFARSENTVQLEVLKNGKHVIFDNVELRIPRK